VVKILKKSIYLIVLVLMLNLVIAQENQDQPSWTAEVTPICEGVCLEGNEAVWLVQINNVGNVPLKLSQIYLIDDENIAFGFIDLTNDDATIQAGQSGSVPIQGIVPPPSRSSTLFYKLNYVVQNEIFPDTNFRRMNVMPQSDIECVSNDFCDRNEICAGYKCMPYNLFNASEVPKPSNSITNDSIQIILLSLSVFILMLITVILFKKKK
jgi:hypothetical protein